MNRIDMNKARDLSGIGAPAAIDAAVQDAIHAAFSAREVIIEAAFRKEFGNPEEMNQEQIASIAEECHQECQLVDGVNHYRFVRGKGDDRRVLVEIVQQCSGDTLNTSFRSEIGDLGLGEA
jgi:hypothetical protein